MHLFNGNLVLPAKQESFQYFLSTFNMVSRYSHIPFNPLLALPTLDDSWICGFTDAEGCFTCSLLGNSNAYRFRFFLDQKHAINLPILIYLAKLLNGKVRPHYVEDVNTMVVNGVRNMNAVIRYFTSHSLRTKKIGSFRVWIEVREALISKQHLDPKGREALKANTDTINR